MKQRSIRNLGVAGILLAGLTLSPWAVGKAEKAGENKYSVGDVMKKLHKPKDNNVFGRVTSGKGSEADKKLIVECYESMVKAKPEKGDLADWKKKTEAVLTEAKKVAAGDDAAIPKLKTATNCKACHDAFREQ